VVTRDSWTPIGEQAVNVFVDNPAVAAPNPNDKGADQPIPRTEFVVVFVWVEPIAALQTISLTDANPAAKGLPDATPAAKTPAPSDKK
jgi:hypothetical protein